MANATNQIPQSQNEAWGFFGTIAAAAEPRAAWDMAFRAIEQATRCEPWEVRAFLDSRYGRHFADGVVDGMARLQLLEDAISTTAAIWMAWRISRATSKETGIPQGLPYLTANVIDASIHADAE